MEGEERDGPRQSGHAGDRHLDITDSGLPGNTDGVQNVAIQTHKYILGSLVFISNIYYIIYYIYFDIDILSMCTMTK